MNQREETKSVPPRGTLKQARFRQHQNRLNQRIPPPGDRFHSANRSPDLVSFYRSPFSQYKTAMVGPKVQGDRKALVASADAKSLLPCSFIHITVSGKVRESHPVPMARQGLSPARSRVSAQMRRLFICPLNYKKIRVPRQRE